MSRKLSDVEWSTFLHDVDLGQLNLPQWGGVVVWNGIDVLVYVGPSGEVFTTDISDRTDLLAAYQANYDTASSVWYYNLPQELMNTVIEDAKTVGNAIATSLVAIGSVAGQTAGGILNPILQPTLQSLALPLIIVGIVGVYLLSKRI